jgi:DNA repair protein RadC
MLRAPSAREPEPEPDIERATPADLLRLVNPRAPVDLLDRIGGLESVARADPLEIAASLAGERRIRREDRRVAWAVAAAFELGRRAEIAASQIEERLCSPADVVAWAKPRLARLSHEELWLLGLDGRGHLRGARCIARGGLHGASIRAADPLRGVLRMAASSFVLVHNHPSGDPTPSAEDIVLTRAVAAAARIVGVPLLDHVVIARSGFACVPIDEDTDEAAATRAPGGSGR